MTKYKKQYTGKIVDIYDVMFGNFEAEVLDHVGGVCIAAEDTDNNFYLVEQFRYGVAKKMLEFPAGLTDPGEMPEDTAIRELREEIGYLASNLVPLGHTYASPAYLNEKIHLFYASDLKFVGQDLDENEELTVIKKDLNWIKDKIMSNEITDSKTIALYSRLDHYLNEIKNTEKE